MVYLVVASPEPLAVPMRLPRPRLVVREATSDRSSVQEELDAVNAYLKKLHGQCDEKVESYAEKKRRREAEIAGLKEALTILENETALLQTKSRRLRGVSRHVA